MKLLANLRKLVATRDDAGLLSMMDSTFRVEFDHGKGPAAFRRYWRPESPASRVWGILQHLLAIPAHMYTGTLCEVPYVAARFPFDLDPLRYVVAVRTAASLLAQPAPDAKRVASLDYSIIPLVRRSQPPVMILPGSYVEVLHPVAGRCFAAATDICHPAAHRAFYEKRAGRWRWISLAAATMDDPPELKGKTAVTGW